MSTIGDIVSGAQFRADLANTDRVNTAEWAALASEAITDAWYLAAGARPDFQVSSVDQTIVNGVSASLTLPGNFYDLIDVVYAPDTTAEYSLGPFAWQNRRSPGQWSPPFVGGAVGGSSARLMGNAIYIEPSIRSGGTYRTWYCPKPRAVKWVVRLTATATLPPANELGSGTGHTLSARANGVLVVDGVTAVTGDRILVTNGDNFNQDFRDNGVYVVTAPGSAGSAWVLTRAPDAGLSSQIWNGDCAVATEGTANAGVYFGIASFGTGTLPGVIDSDSWIWGTATIDACLEPFLELLRINTAIPAVIREDDLDPRPLIARQQVLAAELQAYFRQVRQNAGPTRPVDTNAVGPRTWYGGGGW